MGLQPFRPRVALRSDAGQVRICPDRESQARAARELFEASARTAITARGRFRAVLAGGATPRRAYELLAGDPSAGVPPSALAWGRIELYFGDERCVPPDHPGSNYHRLRETLLARAPIPAANVHRIQGELADPAEAAARYEREIRARFALQAEAWPCFDLVLLGLGADGHTASLFPGSAALAEERRIAVVSRAAPGAEPRVTLTLPVLCAAEHVCFLVAGAEKAAALRAALAREPTGAEPPARRVRPANGRLLWLVDQAAAALV